jgi:hypothetical protein
VTGYSEDGVKVTQDAYLEETLEKLSENPLITVRIAFPELLLHLLRNILPDVSTFYDFFRGHQWNVGLGGNSRCSHSEACSLGGNEGYVAYPSSSVPLRHPQAPP